MESAGNDRNIQCLSNRGDQMFGAQPLARCHRYADQAGLRIAQQANDFLVWHVDQRAHQYCFVAMLAQEGCQERRTQRRHSPLAFGIDLQKNDAHVGKAITGLR